VNWQRTAAGVALVGVLLAGGLLGGCPSAGGKQAPLRSGQSASELSAASGALEAAGESVVLVEVKLLGGGGSESRRTAGFVLTGDGKLVCAADPLAMSLGDGEAYARTVRAIFSPGLEDEVGYPCEVLRENAQAGLALLQIDRQDLRPLTLGGEAPAETEVFLIAAPLGLRGLAAHAGKVAGAAGGGDALMLVHTAGSGLGGGGPLVDAEGRLVGLSLADGGDGQAQAIPVARIANWLESPPEDEAPPTKPGVVVRSLLEEAELVFKEQGEEFALPYDNGVTVMVGQHENLIVLVVAPGELPAGSALRALRFNYDDPYGCLALGVDGALLWTARIPVEFASAEYLKTVAGVAAQRALAWRDMVAGEEPPDAADLYPGGDDEALLASLEEIVARSELEFEPSGDRTFKLLFGDAPMVRVTVYKGVAYVYAYSGGMPGADAAEQERIGRELLARNARDPLGRLALDNDDDLAWEAQVPMGYLAPEYLAALARAGTQQVAELLEQYGDVPFNEND